MFNKQKYKYNDRITNTNNKSNKDIGLKALYGSYGQRNNRNIKSQMINVLDLDEKDKDQGRGQQELSVVKRLERHVEFLEKKLEDSYIKTQQLNIYIQVIKENLLQKDLQTQTLQKQLFRSQETIDKVSKKTQKLQSELQNSKLRTKMQTIYLQPTTLKQKQQSSPSSSLNATLKNQKYAKGMFSSSSNQKLTSSKDNQILKSVIVEQTPQTFTLQTNNNHIINAKPAIFNKEELQSPLNQYLIQQLSKIKQQKNQKQLYNAALQNKITLLKKQLLKYQRQVQILRNQKRPSNELALALQKIRQQDRQYKMLMVKYKDCQKKLSEVNKSTKSTTKIDAFSQSRIFSTSLEDINGLIYKISKGLTLDQMVIDINIHLNNSTQTSSQTQPSQSIYLQKIKSSQILIQKLSQKMVQKQQIFKLQSLKLKQTYESQINQYIQQVQEHRLQIEELNLALQNYKRYEKQQDTLQLQRILNAKQYNNIGIMCSLISYQQWQERQDIVAKVQVLYRLNQQLDRDNKQMKQTIKHLLIKINRSTQDRSTQIQPQQQLQQQINNNDQANIYKHQNIKLKESIALITSQKQHFHHQYTQLLLLYTNIQIQLQQSRQNQLKTSHQLNSLLLQQTDKIQQIQRYKKQIIELQVKMTQFQEIRRYDQDKGNG